MHLVSVRGLPSYVEYNVPFIIEHADACLNLKKHVHLSPSAVSVLDDHGGFAERSFNISHPYGSVSLYVAFLVNFRSIWLHCFQKVGDDWKRFIVNFNKLRRSLCCLQIFCGDNGHRVPKISHLVVTKDRLIGHDDAKPIEPGNILVDKNRYNTWDCFSFLRVDFLDQSVRVLASGGFSIEHVRQCHVRKELGLASNFARPVFADD